MSGAVTFSVPGLPAPQGSKRAFVIKGTGRAVMVEDNARTKPWRVDVALIAQHAMQGREMLTGPLVAVFTFTLPRPKSHYRGGDPARDLRASAPSHRDAKPDADKLYRAVGDALTGIVYYDDAQLADVRVVKRYGFAPGLSAEIAELE